MRQRKFRAEFARRAKRRDVRRAKIARAHAEAAAQCTAAVEHIGGLGVVGIADGEGRAVVGEQLLLGIAVVREGRVFKPADVVGRKVGERDRVKRNAVHALKIQRLRGHLQHDGAAARAAHQIEIIMQFQALRCGILRVKMIAHKVHAVGADIARGHPVFGQNRRQHQRRCGLALGAGDADDGQIPRRETVKRGADLRQRAARIIGVDNCCIVRQRECRLG